MENWNFGQHPHSIFGVLTSFPGPQARMLVRGEGRAESLGIPRCPSSCLSFPLADALCVSAGW